MDKKEVRKDNRTSVLDKLPQIIHLVLTTKGNKVLSITYISKKLKTDPRTVKKAFQIYEIFNKGPEINIVDDLIGRKRTAIFLKKPKEYIKELEKIIKNEKKTNN